DQISLLRTNISVFSKSLELTRNRRKGGIVSDLDVSQAETILRSTEGQLPAIELQRVKLEHALAVLVGEYPSTFRLERRPVSKPPLTLPSGLPSELLERRPDIASAERRMAAANAGIGVAKAAFFPTLRLNGSAGFESVSASSLFSGPSRFWAVGPSLTLPLFEGGQLRARYRQAKFAHEETVADYRQTVLVAFTEVEDNLAAQRLLAEELVSKNAALASSRKTLEIASNRYRSGLVTFLEVATAQNEELAREQETVRLSAERQIASVALIKALGGSWQKPSK
ncbi:MAG: efflux system, outer rane lipoprotein NodT family, partial [Verrucomicrobiales bacterium]|nr:efflux system, outer rane lipoprotein NodT family [Verrucomicrobiales bacterium]